MAISQDIQPRPDYLHASMRGEYDHQQYRENLVRVVEAAITHKLPKILLDCRQVTGGPTIGQRQELGTLLADQRFQALIAGKPTNHQIAHVANPPLRHPDSPAIAMANQRGGNSKMFGDVDDALKWLGVDGDKG